MPKAQLAKWGNSLAVRIPKSVAEQARIQEGDAILIAVVNGRVELRPVERIPTLEELVAQITPGELLWRNGVGSRPREGTC